MEFRLKGSDVGCSGLGASCAWGLGDFDSKFSGKLGFTVDTMCLGFRGLRL